jgi:hypothetical protein
MMLRIVVAGFLSIVGVWSAIQAQETITLTNPIAYIGLDHNLYLTDGTITVPITTDAALDESGQGITYAQPRWSQDGSQLAFIRNMPPYGETLLLTESGAAPAELIGAADGVYFENRTFAWSPDGSEIAFIGTANAPFALYAVSVENRRIRTVAQTLGPSIGEGDGSAEPPYELAWSDAGIVYGPAACFCTALTAPRGPILGEWPLGSRILTSADGIFILILDMESHAPRALVDVSNQTEVTLELPEGAHPIALIDGSLLFTTRTVVETVASDPAAPAGAEVFVGIWGSFSAQTAILSVWQRDPAGEETLIFDTEGNNFSLVRPTADNRLLVSITTSNFDAVTTLNNGAVPEDVQDLLAHPVTYLIEGGEVILTFDGSQPDYSSGTFTVTLAE